MCLPQAAGAALSVGMSLATSVVGFSADQADYSARAAQWQQNYTNSLAAGRDEQNQLLFRTMEEQDAQAQRIHLTNIEEAEVRAETEVSAAAAGVSGVSVDNLIQDVARKAGAKREADRINHQNTVAQLTAELEATNTGVQNRINSVQRPTAPSAAGAILGGIGGAMKSIPIS